MTSPLPADCLREIFEIFQDDMFTLHSCILVNRLWCEVAAPLFWRKTVNLRLAGDQTIGSLFRTWISCLPEGSKRTLSDHGIIITSPTTHPPLFDYPGFCRSLSYGDVLTIINTAIGQRQIGGSRNLYNKHLIKQELFKVFVSHCPTIDFLDISESTQFDLPLPYFPGAEICFSKLRKLHCNSSTPPWMFYRMAQICRNLETLVCMHTPIDNDGLATLIEVQCNLQRLEFHTRTEICGQKPCPSIERALRSCTDSLVHLSLRGDYMNIPAAAISEFDNLKILDLHFSGNINKEILENLEFNAFPQLEVLRMGGNLAPLEMIQRLIRRTGGNLKVVSLYGWDIPKEEIVRKFNNDIIPKFCPKLQCLTTWCTEKNFKDIESILCACPHLEALSLRSLPIDGYGIWSQVDGDPLFQLLANKAPENFSKLRIGGEWSFGPQALATFLSIRKIKEKSFTLCVCDCYDEADALIEVTPKHDEVINNYRECGILKYKYEFEFIGEFD